MGKKLGVLLLTVSLLFAIVACSSEQTPKEDATETLVRVTLSAQKGTSKALTDANDFNVDSITTWKYTATKKDSGATTGQTAEPVALENGQTQPLSLGIWSFTLYGYNANNLVCSGPISEVSVSETAKTFSIPVQKLQEDTGFITIGNVSITGLTASDYKQVVKVYKDSKESEEKTVDGSSINVASGSYKVVVTYLDKTTSAEVAKGITFVTVYDNLTTTVSGTLETTTSGATKDADIVTVETDVSGKNTEEVTFNVASTPVAANSTATAEEKKTTVKFPAGSLKVDSESESKEVSLEISSAPIAEASSTYTVAGSNNAVVAGFDFNLTGVESTSFADGVEIETYISKGLGEASTLQIQYVGTETGTDPSIVSYDSATGKIVFKVYHFSKYAIVTTKYVAVDQSGKMYESLSAALTDTGATEIYLLKEVAAEDLSKEVTINLNGKTFKKEGGFVISGNVTIKNGSVENVTINSGDVKFENVNSKNIGVGDNFEGSLAFDGGVLEGEADGKNAFLVKEDVNQKRAAYVFKNLKVNTGTQKGIKIARAKSITIENCVFDGANLNPGTTDPDYLTRSTSAIDIVLYNVEGESAVDISITGCTFKDISSGDGYPYDTAGAIKIKNHNAITSGGLGKVVITGNEFSNCVRDVVIGKANDETVASSSFVTQTPAVLDADGKIDNENWTIANNKSASHSEDILVCIKSADTKIKAEIGKVVGGCYVYDISTAYVAIGDKVYCKYVAIGDKVYCRQDISTDSTLTFGKIPSSVATYGGQDITWKVLEVKEDKILVLSEKVLFNMKHYETTPMWHWEDSLIKAYLNKEGTDGFVSQYGLNEVAIVAATSEEAGYEAGDVFLLSMKEVQFDYFNDGYNSGTAYNLAGTATEWWCRNYGSGDYDFMYVWNDGYFDSEGEYAYQEYGVRPAFWISLE